MAFRVWLSGIVQMISHRGAWLALQNAEAHRLKERQAGMRNYNILTYVGICGPSAPQPGQLRNILVLYSCGPECSVFVRSHWTTNSLSSSLDCKQYAPGMQLHLPTHHLRKGCKGCLAGEWNCEV